jgi:hypothetical protein
MAFIYEETFQDGTDKALTIRNEEFGRVLEIGTDWTTLYVGIMMSIEPSGSNNISNASLRIGMSPSATDHIGNATPQMWYGIQVGTNTSNIGGSTFTYNVGSGNPVYTGDGIVRMRMITGSFSAALNVGSPTIPIHTGSVLRKWPIVVRFAKSGTNINVNGYVLNGYTSAANAAKYFSTQDFLTALDDVTSTGSPSLSGSAMTSIGNTNFSYTDHTASYGELTSVHVGWNKSFQDLRIWSIAVSRKE